MLGGEVGFEIRKLHLIINREFEKSNLDKNKPTKLQLAMLVYLHQNEVDNKSTYQKDIERDFEIRPSTATGILRKMEKEGLIKRVSEKQDARLKRIVATEKADILRNELRKNFDKLREQMTKGLTEEEIKQYIEITKKIQANILEASDDKAFN